ncbi:DUF1284 domain-containing protein [Methanobrevibacter millerae]|uniref:DUF1284 domain-containing protein n=1 Tax=Methanobrevibacter millerae TaxID=230361 RepID=A0A0U2L416_9EURY|nr:DUF1284 domain-containing protein [Methanobrevibacter millerae]ALT68382.1 hypothetical protein sm9_0583 [Methanobrevibacter millerae]
MELRGHHLLCILGFQGYGYSEDFVLNMTRINELRKTDKTTIKLINSSDDICSACPNLKNDLCENEMQNETIVKMDEEVLSEFDINKEYNAIDLFNEVILKFNTLKSVENICNDCKWAEKCLFYKKLK